MAKSDYLRPADYQINVIYKCDACGKETNQSACYGVDSCQCGGILRECGYSYPANCDDWDEERGRTGEWHQRR